MTTHTQAITHILTGTAHSIAGITARTTDTVTTAGVLRGLTAGAIRTAAGTPGTIPGMILTGDLPTGARHITTVLITGTATAAIPALLQDTKVLQHPAADPETTTAVPAVPTAGLPGAPAVPAPGGRLPVLPTGVPAATRPAARQVLPARAAPVPLAPAAAPAATLPVPAAVLPAAAIPAEAAATHPAAAAIAAAAAAVAADAGNRLTLTTSAI